MPEQSFFEPLLSPVLRDRRFITAISGAAFLQLGLVGLKLSGWQCPVLHTLGIPCPGCGLTRAIILLFQGNWQQSITYHAFAPVFVVGIFLIAGTVLLPAGPRARVADSAESLERRTGITSLLLLGLILYWLARLLIMQSTFIKLIQG